MLAKNVWLELLDQQFHSRLYLALQFFRGRRIGANLKRFQAWDELDSGEYQKLVERNLAETLTFAHENVPLYKMQAWERAFISSSPADLSSWPVLERHSLYQHANELMAVEDNGQLTYRKSSASTDRPVRVAWDPAGAAWSWANEYRAMQWHGIPIGVKTLMIWGVEERIVNLVLNRRFYSSKKLSAENIEQAAKDVLEKQPALIWGYPSAVTQLARYIGARYGETGRQLVKFVKIGGEQVYDFQRADIRRYLGSQILEVYGCSEIGSITATCPHGSRHIYAPSVKIEIFKDGEPAPPGEFGDLIATSLVNRAMPLVRYRIGDRGRISPEPCQCGLPHPVLEELESRATDMLTASDGTRVHGSSIGKKIASYTGSTPLGLAPHFLFQQLDMRTWKVLVEDSDQPREPLVNQVTEVVHGVFGKDCRVEVEFVSFIPREPSGKFRYYRLAQEPGQHASLPVIDIASLADQSAI